MDENVIIQETLDFIVNYIEKPHPQFGNLPVCPFSKTFRVKDRIKFMVYPLGELDTTLLLLVEFFAAQRRYDSFFLIHPDKNLSLEALTRTCDGLKSYLQPLGIMLFRGHPHDDYHVGGGVYPRREPYPGFQLLKESLVFESRKKLSSRYFEKWLKETMAEDGIGD